jgi:hypothetical protein
MDLVSLARTARENLARGLGALQTPGVPPGILRAAEPLANAMSALHRVESTRGAAAPEAAPAALGALRQALAQLQGTQVRHAAIDQATEAIAGALGMVHQLTALSGQASVAPSPPTQPSSQYQMPNEVPPQVAVVGQQPGWQQQPPNPVAQTQLAPSWGQQAAPPPQQQWQQPAAAPAQQAWPQAAPPQQQWPQQAPPQPAGNWQQPAPAQAPAAQAAAHAPTGKVMRFEADLGAHSTTNFYKGLSGNDVVDSGGIFIATYNIPDVGQELAIKVSMPGGYEFEAMGVVRWTRDSPQSGTDSPPGFGAQFTQISPEGRQLVYRYVRNREPLFHDDL